MMKNDNSNNNIDNNNENHDKEHHNKGSKVVEGLGPRPSTSDSSFAQDAWHPQDPGSGLNPKLWALNRLGFMG